MSRGEDGYVIGLLIAAIRELLAVARTQWRRVSGVIPLLVAIKVIAAHCDG